VAACPSECVGHVTGQLAAGIDRELGAADRPINSDRSGAPQPAGSPLQSGIEILGPDVPGDRAVVEEVARLEVKGGVKFDGLRAGLYDADAAYEEWHQRTAERRERAAAAMAELTGRGQPWTPPGRLPARDDAEIAQRARQAREWARADPDAEPETAPERPAAWHPGEREPIADADYDLEAGA
jgi:hypothetical protein